MRIGARSFGLWTALALVATSMPAATAEVKAVVELFTSQGCNSCPPADRVLGELTRENHLIALSVPVDYWDYLGWRDTLALHAHSVRQRAYSINRGDRQVYTPQVVINGVAEAIGSNRDAIERIIGNPPAAHRLTVPVSLRRHDSQIEVEVGGGTGTASVWLLGVTREVPVAIKKGENRGKTITYHNAVRSWSKLGEWGGQPARLSFSVAELSRSGADACVVLIQSGTAESPGAIRGAAMLSLH